MKLSSSAKHAVRFVYEVARLSDGKTPVRISEIADTTGLSGRFLGQLAIELKSHSILQGVCGRNGGYLLTQPANNISIGRVIRAISGSIRISSCSENSTSCLNSDLCAPRVIWSLIQERVDEVLNAYTVADLLDKTKMDWIRSQLDTESPALVKSLRAI